MAWHFDDWMREWAWRAARRLWCAVFAGGPRDVERERPQWQPWPL